MKKYTVILGAAVILPIVAFAIGSASVGSHPNDADGAFATLGPGTPGVVLSEETSLPAPGDITAAADPNQSVYFFPMDTSNTTTVFSLANTGSTKSKVLLIRHSLGGSVLGTVVSVTFDPGTSVTIYSDDVVAGWPGLLWDLGTSTAYVELAMPPSMVVDGYIAWTTASLYDPGAFIHRLPLRFVATP